MADAALFDGGGDDGYVAEAGQLALHCREAGRVDAVVVSEQDLHVVPERLVLDEWVRV